MQARDEFIAFCAQNGCSSREIQRLLVTGYDENLRYRGYCIIIAKTFIHGCCSIRHIQRIRKRKGVGARMRESPLELIQQCIQVCLINNELVGLVIKLFIIIIFQKELMGPGRLLGYRSMWYRLKHKYYLSVRR